jgi:hypothetical protein
MAPHAVKPKDGTDSDRASTDSFDVKVGRRGGVVWMGRRPVMLRTMTWPPRGPNVPRLNDPVIVAT